MDLAGLLRDGIAIDRMGKSMGQTWSNHVLVLLLIVVVGTNKDWGPENKLSEPILEFAWCSLGASMEFSTV